MSTRAVPPRAVGTREAPAVGTGGRLARTRPRLLTRTWVATLALAMVIASDYKLRSREADSSLAGQVDAQILVEIGVYAAVAAFLALQLVTPPSLVPARRLLAPAWGWAAFMALSVVWAIYPASAAVRGVQLLIIAGLAHTIAAYARREHLHLLAHTYVVVTVLSVFLGVVVPSTGRRRFDWLQVHPVVVGTYLGLTITILVAYLVRSRADRRRFSPSWPIWVYVVALAICVAALLATRTRGAMGAAVVGTMVALLLNSRRPRRIDILAVTAVIVTLGLLAYGPVIGRFLSRGADVENLETFNGRTPLWSAAIRFFADQPLVGYGLTAAKGLFLDTIGLGGGHNAFINVLINGGLIGTALWLWLIVVVISTIRRLWGCTSVSADLPMLAAMMAFFLVNSMTYEGLGAAANLSNVWCYVIVGWLAVLARQAGQESTGLRRETNRLG